MSIAYLTQDLLFSSRVASTAASLGLAMSVVSSPAQLLESVATGDVHMALLEFSTPQLDLLELVPRLRSSAPRSLSIVAFGPHVDVSGLAGARQAGCDAVYTRGQFNQQMSAVLRRHGCTL